MNTNKNKFWTLQDVFVVFISVFALELLLFTSLYFFGFKEFIGQFDGNPYIKSLLLLVTYLLQVVGMILPLWFIIIRRYKSGLEEFKFKWIGTKKTILWVLGGYLFYIGLSIMVITIFFSFSVDTIGFEPTTTIFEIFGSDIFSLVIAFIVAVLIAPFFEELFFRGFLLQALIKNVGVTWGIVITTLVFAAIHFEFQSIMPLIILSLVLNVIFIKTKSIYPGIIFHIMNNTISFFALYYLENSGVFL